MEYMLNYNHMNNDDGLKISGRCIDPSGIFYIYPYTKRHNNYVMMMVHSMLCV